MYKPEQSEVKYGRSDALVSHHAYKGDLFALILMTEAQELQLMQNGSKIICVDTTYDVTIYKHKLMSILVKDKYGFGYTVATCITNYEDQTMYEVFFQAVRDRVPKFVAQCLMADNSTPLKNAARKIFGPALKIINCDWHTCLNWNRNANKISNKVEKLEVLCLTKMALKERKEAEFNRIINCLFVQYAHCKVFLEYFCSTYMGKVEEWAHHKRNFFHDDVDTNMLCESWHNKLKTYYMKRFPKRRLDQTVAVLLRAEHDRYKTDFQRKSEGMSCKKKERGRRHMRGLQMDDHHVTANSVDSWTVLSATNDKISYIVEKKRDDCIDPDHCFSACMEMPCFGLCGHLYSCNCPDRAMLCKHVHKVHSYTNRGVLTKVYALKICC